MRKMVPLSPRLDGKLKSYVATAKANASNNASLAVVMGAMGMVGLSLAIPPLANSEIVYTPANRSIGGSNAFSTMQIDLDNDGTPDLVLSAYNIDSFSSGFHILGILSAKGLQGNQILETHQKLVAADAQARLIGESVSADLEFGPGGVMALFDEGSNGRGSFHKTSRGFWLGAKNKYLGVKFSISGETHYGWARLNANAGSALLTGYAYETVPNKPIRAGILPTPESNADPQRPPTLGVLAMGAVVRNLD